MANNQGRVTIIGMMQVAVGYAETMPASLARESSHERAETIADLVIDDMADDMTDKQAAAVHTALARFLRSAFDVGIAVSPASPAEDDLSGMSDEIFRAVEQSVLGRATVHLDWSRAREAALLSETARHYEDVDGVDTGEAIEVWGKDEDGDGWRIHLHRPAFMVKESTNPKEEV